MRRAAPSVAALLLLLSCRSPSPSVEIRDDGLVATLEDYWTRPLEKALFLAADAQGHWAIGYAYGREHQGEAEQEALSQCRSSAEAHGVGRECHAYASGQHAASVTSNLCARGFLNPERCQLQRIVPAEVYQQLVLDELFACIPDEALLSPESAAQPAPGEVSSSVLSAARAFCDCYLTHQGPDLGIRLVVDGRGRVIRAVATPETADDVAICLERGLADGVLPAPPLDPTEVTIRLRSPARPAERAVGAAPR